MNKRQVAVVIGSMALLVSGSAMAGRVDLSVGIGVPVAPVAPVYVEPAPVYVASQPAVVAYPGYGYGSITAMTTTTATASGASTITSTGIVTTTTMTIEPAVSRADARQNA